MLDELIKKLDLADFISSFNSFFARKKPIYIEGDVNVHFRFISELSKFEFIAPKSVENLDKEIVHLLRHGVLRLEEIFEFIKIVRYFLYLKSLKFEGIIFEWLNQITIPEPIISISNYFDETPTIKNGVIPKLDSINEALRINKTEISRSLQYLISSAKLAPYLVDKQIHYVNNEEALLVRGGFNHVLKAQIINRSTSGFFYVIPEAIQKLKEKESDLLSTKEEILYEFCKESSLILTKHLLFLKYINREFDRFDHYQARIFFARSRNLEFILPKKDDRIILKDFLHPAIEKPKPINIDFSKKILMITGVNAGGKTMLLKSILSSVFLSKYLIPFKIDANSSHIGTFKEIEAIIEDPQNVKNDISTFAGRIISFSKIFSKRGILLGIDEIELGTDADEAASLFKVILEHLIQKEHKIVITTHHKRLASLMAGNNQVELLAAIFDTQRQMPTFEFLKGTIGKSYAFETAERYGIPKNIINEAKIVYGQDKERLNELIERSSILELELTNKKEELKRELEKVKNLKEELIDQKQKVEEEIKELKSELEKLYYEAINEARKAAKLNDTKEIHRLINKAHLIVNSKKFELKDSTQPVEFKIGDSVKSGKTKGVIIAISKDDATILTNDGLKLRLPKSLLKLSGNQKQEPPKAPKVVIENPKHAAVSIDLHGLRADEAIEKLDKFISDALIAGFDEVLVYHGIGTGKLAFAVKEFLSKHPKVKEFSDAPFHMGGFGAKVVRL